MFGRKKGGIEQAFVDYSKSLTDLGCEVIVLAYQDAPIINMLPEDINVKTLTNFGQWDPVATWKLKKMIKELEPDIIITHGNRASTLLNRAVGNITVVSVCHNYNAKQFNDTSIMITVTEDLRRTMIKKGADENNIFTVPNMVYVPERMPEREFIAKEVPVIGTMGRFVAKKGFNIFLKSLTILKARGIKFKAIIGGDGNEADKLKALCASLGLNDYVEFPGWIEDKEHFYKTIDMFCLPSLQEPFGIVLLEAFINCVPVVTTDTEGPIEIARPHIDALMVEAGNVEALADSFEKFIRNPKFAERIAKEGFKTVTNNYDSKMVGRKLYSVLEKIINKNKEKIEAQLESVSA
jgi:glycosyltransferase involved in cell wall biosynthesis